MPPSTVKKGCTMRRAPGFGLCLLLMACASVPEIAPMPQPLTITVTCKDNPSCVFRDEDLFLDIAVTNTTAGTIGFPLAFVQKTGPSIRLSDRRTGQETNLRTTAADFALKDDLTPIAPGGAARIAWLITVFELRQMGGADVDLDAEVTVGARIARDGQRVPVLGKATLRIVEKRAR